MLSRSQTVSLDSLYMPPDVSVTNRLSQMFPMKLDWNFARVKAFRLRSHIISLPILSGSQLVLIGCSLL